MTQILHNQTKSFKHDTLYFDLLFASFYSKTWSGYEVLRKKLYFFLFFTWISFWRCHFISPSVIWFFFEYVFQGFFKQRFSSSSSHFKIMWLNLEFFVFLESYSRLNHKIMMPYIVRCRFDFQNLLSHKFKI